MQETNTAATYSNYKENTYKVHYRPIQYVYNWY